MYRVLICTLNSIEIYSKTFIRESRAYDAYLAAKIAQETLLVDTIATLFEDNVVIHINEHRWIDESENISPWEGRKITFYKPTESDQEKFRRVLQQLHQM